MNSKTWQRNTFTIESEDIPWSCPICNNTTLKTDKENFTFEDTVETKKMKNDEYWEYEWIEYYFSGTLSCKNCNNKVITTGKGEVAYNSTDPYDYDEPSNYQEYFRVLKPLFFLPTLKIIDIPEKCPEKIEEILIDSFSLFWNDFSSCANKIRISIEILLDTQKVNKTKIVRGKRKRIILHDRITLYKSINPEIAELLEAIKWIGNSGSHSMELEKIDLIEAYEILDLALKKIFDDTEKVIKNKAKKINTNKGVKREK